MQSKILVTGMLLNRTTKPCSDATGSFRAAMMVPNMEKLGKLLKTNLRHLVYLYLLLEDMDEALFFVTKHSSLVQIILM